MSLGDSTINFPLVIGIILVILSLLLIVIMMLKRRKEQKNSVFSEEKDSSFKIQSTRRIMNGVERESELKSEIIISSKVGDLKVFQDEVEDLVNASPLRSKYRNKIEKIRKIVYNANKFIALEGIDEILILIENLNLKSKAEVQDIFLEKVLDNAIRFCEKTNEGLINESHIKEANLKFLKKELGLKSKIPVIEEKSHQEVLFTPEQVPKKLKTPEKEVNVIESEENLEEPEIFQEALIEPSPEDMTSEVEIINEELSPKPQEILENFNLFQKDVEVSSPEEQRKELVSPEPIMIKCPFCNFQIDTKQQYCPQCGYRIKK